MTLDLVLVLPRSGQPTHIRFSRLLRLFKLLYYTNLRTGIYSILHTTEAMTKSTLASYRRQSGRLQNSENSIDCHEHLHNSCLVCLQVTNER